jgi:hypothetical protein
MLSSHSSMLDTSKEAQTMTNAKSKSQSKLGHFNKNAKILKTVEGQSKLRQSLMVESVISKPTGNSNKYKS